MKAIKTKYIGSTSMRGSRVKASDEDGNRITLGWNHDLDQEQNHYEAARALCHKMGWDSSRHGRLIGGGFKDCYVWVFENSMPWLYPLRYE